MGKLAAVVGLACLVVGGCSLVADAQRESDAKASAWTRERREADERAETRREAERAKQRDADEQRTADAKADARASEKRAQKKEVDQREEFCASDRDYRIKTAKAQLHEHKQWAATNHSKLAYFIKHCDVFDSRGVKVSREHVSDGVVFRVRDVGQAEDVKCDGSPGRPKGLDASWVREMNEQAEVVVSPGTSGACAEADLQALGTTLVVPVLDHDAMARVLALPGSTPP